MRQIHPKTKARVGVGILAAMAMVAIAPWRVVRAARHRRLRHVRGPVAGAWQR